MAGRSTSSGRGKRAKADHAGRRNSAPYQRRVDRDHGGPPAHLRTKPGTDEAKRRFLERAVIAAKVHARPAVQELTPTSTLPAPPLVEILRGDRGLPITAPRSALPAGLDEPPQPATSTQIFSDHAAIARTVNATVEAGLTWPVTAHPAANRQSVRSRRFAIALLASPFLAVPILAVLGIAFRPASLPAPPISSPQSIATAPLRSELAIRQRILEMTSPITLPRAEPALPGSIRHAALALPTTPPEIPAIAQSDAPTIVALPPWEAPALPFAVTGLPPALEPPAAAAAVEPSPRSTEPVQPAATPPQVAVAAGIEVPQCTADVAAIAATAPLTTLQEPAAFGQALALAAHEQIQKFVVYDARYTRIAFPGGDVASLHGVCTDVVIRAYRALGIDLQRIVYDSRVGVGDTSIDHRRTETLRRFFAVHGETLPATGFAEDYRAGDIVTYHRPQNRISTAHIAIVSDQLGPSGRPMIIHNRGNGVQLEDALFVDRITGHYRYTGPKEPLAPLAVAARPRPTVASVQATLRATSTLLPASPVTIVRTAARSPAAHKLALKMGGAIVSPGVGAAATARRSP